MKVLPVTPCALLTVKVVGLQAARHYLFFSLVLGVDGPPWVDSASPAHPVDSCLTSHADKCL